MPHATFRCASLSAFDFEHPGLAIATARAGGVGLLDAAHVRSGGRSRAADTIARLLAGAPIEPFASVGLRLRASQIESCQDLLRALASRPHWVVVCDWTPRALPAVLEGLIHDGREVWLEIGAGRDLSSVEAALPFAGWIGVGAECGGLTGTESTFILAQYLSAQTRPFLLRGGIGEHTAAACRACGAAGVVLDDTLLLLRESPLPARWRHLLARLGLTDTSTIGRACGTAVRVLDRPDVAASRELRVRAAEIDGAADSAAAADAWAGAVEQLVGWDEPERAAWPIGEMAGRAHEIAVRHRTVGRYIRAVLDVSAQHLQDAARLAPLAPGAPLAASHGTRFPIVQGPMTRVSDTAGFATAVAEHGALPLLALALMRAPEVEQLLAATSRALPGRPWGVGILGFVPPELRREQLEVVDRIRPAFALIAGGRPDQAADLESRGIHTYLHVPAPLLLPFLEQGARRFVFEGGECGGHIGPLHSFALWDYAVAVLSERVSAADVSSVHVLFAGGIHDARSAAMVAALAAPLAMRGMKIGVLMGTAYLFTGEAVAHGAITPKFQRLAVDSDGTALIETGPGHVIRCASTPFVGSFEAERHALRERGLAGPALGDALEQLVVGRSRIASKGLERRREGLVPIDETRQHAEGVYMLGDVAGLRQSTISMERLHDTVSREGSQRLAEMAADGSAAPVVMPARPAAVAIIGAAALVPGAADLDTFWNNLLARTNAITEIPADRWDWRMLYDADQTARDRIYSRWGGFIAPVPFNPVSFGIPPKSMTALTPPQLLALELTRRALADAGFAQGIADPAIRARTAVIFGAASTADYESLYNTRASLPLILPQIDDDILARLPEWTEESYPAQLANVVAGRVANRFDLGGSNFTVDAACASSLAALDLAVREVAEGRSDLVITGGIDFDQSPHAYMGFSRTRAFSPRGRADVFDARADGIVISEGGVVFVLKRLADAERDGDRIYAVIQSVAGSSDGRGLSLTSPKPEGQRLALDRAYTAAGIDPASIGLYEAHGTGTKVGDAAEVESVTRFLRRAGAGQGDCAIGSVKSLLGHTRTAAGMVSLLKVALALHYRVVPPHAGITRPLPVLAAADAPLQVYAEPQPWLTAGGTPRRAGLSAFGFGGTNFHAVLEEYRGAIDEAPPGAREWPMELFVIAAADREALADRLRRLDAAAARLEQHRADGSIAVRFTLRDLAFVCASEASSTPDTRPADARPADGERVALLAATAGQLRERIATAMGCLNGDEGSRDGLFRGSGPPSGTLAALFPGQGSQYPGMGRELALYVPEVRAAFEHSTTLLADLPGRLDRVVFPGAAFDDDSAARQRRQLADTRIAQPAIGTLSCGLLDFARRLRVPIASAAGHSYGEFVALHAAGSLSREDLLRLSAVRGRAMSEVGPDTGAMAMVALSEDEASPYLDAYPGVVVANLNAPRQVVISGPTEMVAAVAERLRADGQTVIPLAVSGAFHSPLMSPARPVLEEALAATAIGTLSFPVHGNLDGAPYPSDAGAIRTRLGTHLEQRVNFASQIEAMYVAGVRTFLELGPGHVLSGLVSRILGQRPHVAVTGDGGMTGWLAAIGKIFATGHVVDVPALFAHRDVRWVDLDRLPEASVHSAEWYLNGGRMWPAGAAAGTAGRAPLLTLESAAEARDSQLATPDSRLSTPDPDRRPAFARAVHDASFGEASSTADARLSSEQIVLQAYREYEETMRQFLDQQERMLQQVVFRARGFDTSVDAPATTPVAPPAAERLPAPPPAATTPEGVLDRQTLVTRLLDLVSDRTGYATSTLGLDLDLEADLGIDSIKRIEILGNLAKSLPEVVGPRMQGQLDQLTRLRSLNAIADLVLETVASGLSAAPAIVSSDRCPRFVMRAQAAALGTPLADALEGVHVVTEDSLGAAAIVVADLRARGGKAWLVAHGTLADADQLRQRVREIEEIDGPVTGVLHLAAVGRALLDDNLDAWRSEAAVTTKQFFTLLQACSAGAARAAALRTVVAVTSMGGDWCRSGGPPGCEVAAGCHGILRCFATEHPRVRAAVVDVNDVFSVEEIARVAVAEFLAGTPDPEVGYRERERVAFRAQPRELASTTARETWRPQAGWVVLVTGGGRGITAEICRELAGPGVRLVIVGRRPADAPDPDRTQHLEAFRRAGADVEYHACDVRDERDFGGLLDALYARFGRIDAVVHGAGVLEDQRFEAKTAASFDRVFDTKVDSAVILAEHLRGESLRWVVYFSSVTGRFGNRGQADYAAANDVLTRLAWSGHRRWPAARVVSICWGPWSGGGMVDEMTRHLLASRGIATIAPAEGRRFFVDELSRGSMTDVEVIAGDGPWRDAGAIAVVVGGEVRQKADTTASF